MEKENILIVEDDGIIGIAISKMLTDMGYAVSGLVDSGEEAIRKAEETCPSLILMDIQLIGEMNGIEAAGQISSRFDIPVIYLTAYSDDARLEQAKLTTPYGYLIKPVQGRELRAAIEMAIHKHETDRKSEESRRQTEAHIHYGQKMESLGVMSGAIAHNVNNIMAAILGYAELIQMELSPESPAQSMIREIIKATERASKMTMPILEYTGQSRIRPKLLRVSTLIGEIMPLIEVGVSKQVMLRYDLSDEIPEIRIDYGQIRQVMINLISNASESVGDKDGMITISTGVMEADRAFLSEPYLDSDLPEGKYVFIDVSDTGCGMDDATKAKIFDPFFSTKFLGRGLGLPAVLGIVRQHRGAVKVFSNGGSGTTIRVLLPVNK